ncbi:MAG: cytochrome c biogenesis protein ResB [Deltaproteobacteria bacterium]|nr:cytochrome c biogenesis protein ResB [Deltaproteobacteria bacterium]
MTVRLLLRRAADFLTSVKLAIPLLVLIAAASILGSLIPQGKNVKLISTLPDIVHKLNSYLQLNDIFHSWWYLFLLALLGLCLLAVTLKRVPVVWKVKGRGPAVGIFLAHMGVILIIGGMIYGALSGFRYYTRVIEGDVTVIPQLPFVVKLEQLDLKYYSREAFSGQGPNFRMAEKQNSKLTLFHHGNPFLQATVAPGNPLSARGVTLLPAQRDVGWAFDLVLTAGGREKVVPIRPWAPPLITLGLGNPSRIMTHRLTLDGKKEFGFEKVPADAAAEVFLLQEDGSGRSLGFARRTEPLTFGAWTISVANIRRYTGLHIYSRPEMPVLMLGVFTLVVGLIGYFTRWGRSLLSHFRYDIRRQRRWVGQESVPGGSEVPEQVRSHVVHAARD